LEDTDDAVTAVVTITYCYYFGTEENEHGVEGT